MFGAEWKEKTFELFKREPNSGKIFELILSEIEYTLQSQNFNELVSEDSTASYCGISFKKDQLLYHCSDCALDETCVLCEKCFNYDAHKDHNFWYTIGTNNSGSCDCGEEDSWKNDLKCPHHVSRESNEESSQNNPHKLQKLKEIVVPILSYLMESLNKYACTRNETKTEESVVILYNDENHSFDDVIDTLCTEIEISEEAAGAYAQLVDTKGFAPILVSSASTCARLSRKFRTLVSSVESLEMTFQMILVTEILSILSVKVASSMLLRKLFVEWFLLTNNESNNLGQIFELDHMLWKSVRLGFNEILNSCNAIDQESKKLIALTYCKHYNKIFDSFLKEKRESHLSATNFSVQIFTLIPVAEYCLENTNILADIFSKMVEILEPGFHQGTGMDFSKLRSFNFQKFSVLTHDALHLTRNVRRKSLNIPNLIKNVDTFMYLLSLLTHMQGHFIKTGDHVTYDRDNYDNANYICFEIQQIAQEFSKIIITNCELSSIWSLFNKYIDQKSSLSRLIANMKEDEEEKYRIKPLFKSKKRCSFFGSLAWFYSSCVKEAMKAADSELNVPSKVVKCFAIDSLHRLLFSAEVKSNLWVRNGLIIRQQEYFYSSTVYHNLTYFADVYNCIIGSHLMDRIPFIEMIVKNSCIVEYLQNQDQTGPVVDQFMIIFMNCCTSKIPEIDSDQILINSLCTESLTKSSLIKILPEFISDEVGFRQKLLEMSRLTSTNSIGVDAKLEIIKTFMDRFDPFYWAFSMNLRLKAWSNYKEQSTSSGNRQGHQEHLNYLYEIFVSKYQLPTEITKEADFLIEMLLNFADSSSTDYEFALEMLLIILKAVNCITSDQDCLKRIANCIEKFKLKRNIPERVMNFLASICPEIPECPNNYMAIDDQGENNIRRKSSLLASFKRQRDFFITDPQEIYEEDEHCCVVCSESGNGEVEGNFLGVPIQVNESTLMSMSYSGKSQFVKGCYHLVHKKCFDSLPAASPGCGFKKCSLCNCAIDFVIPLITESESFSLNLVDNFDELKTLNNFDVLNDPEINLFCPRMNFCSTISFISQKVECIESIPLHQIFTLTQLKRNFILNTKDKNKFNTEGIKKLFENDPSKLNNVEHLEILISCFTFYILDKLSIEDFSCVYKKLATVQNLEHINLALNLFMNESFNKTDIVKQEIDCDLSSNQDVFNMNFKMNLVELPYRHDLFLKEYLTKKCDHCKSVPRSGAVCLLCGSLICVGQQCCRSEDLREGECCMHRKNCAGNVGIFLLIRSCALLIISDSIGAIVPAPYVNAFGEHDFDLTSSSALFLHNQLYYKKLTDMTSIQGTPNEFEYFELMPLHSVLIVLIIELLVDKIPRYFSLKDVKKAIDTTCGSSIKTIDKFSIFKVIETGSKSADHQKFLFVFNNGNTLEMENLIKELVHISDRPSVLNIKLADKMESNCEKVPIEEGKTLFVSNFFTNTRLTEISRLFSRYQLRKSLLVPSIEFIANSKYLIVRFETEKDAFLAYRELDGLLIKDMYNSKLIKRLKANLY